MTFENMNRIIFAGDSVADMGSEQPVGEGLFDNVGRSYLRVIENMPAVYCHEIKVRLQTQAHQSTAFCIKTSRRGELCLPLHKTFGNITGERSSPLRKIIKL